MSPYGGVHFIDEFLYYEPSSQLFIQGMNSIKPNGNLLLNSGGMWGKYDASKKVALRDNDASSKNKNEIFNYIFEGLLANKYILLIQGRIGTIQLYIDDIHRESIELATNDYEIIRIKGNYLVPDSENTLKVKITASMDTTEISYIGLLPDSTDGNNALLTRRGSMNVQTGQISSPCISDFDGDGLKDKEEFNEMQYLTWLEAEDFATSQEFIHQSNRVSMGYDVYTSGMKIALKGTFQFSNNQINKEFEIYLRIRASGLDTTSDQSLKVEGVGIDPISNKIVEKEIINNNVNLPNSFWVTSKSIILIPQSTSVTFSMTFSDPSIAKKIFIDSILITPKISDVEMEKVYFQELSNILLPDTDNDGFNDKDEKLAGTSPCQQDTDGDHIKDSEDIDPLDDVVIDIFINEARIINMGPYNDDTILPVTFHEMIGKDERVESYSMRRDDHIGGSFIGDILWNEFNIDDNKATYTDDKEVEIKIWADEVDFSMGWSTIFDLKFNPEITLKLNVETGKWIQQNKREALTSIVPNGYEGFSHGYMNDIFGDAQNIKAVGEIWFDIDLKNDYDLDGLPWNIEYHLAKDDNKEVSPTNPDTNGNGLFDTEEAYRWTYDDLLGKVSIVNSFIPSNPNDPKYAANADFDNDGYTNKEELNNIRIGNWVTDPTISDSDGDGISDHDEIKILETRPWLNLPSESQYRVFNIKSDSFRSDVVTIQKEEIYHWSDDHLNMNLAPYTSNELSDDIKENMIIYPSIGLPAILEKGDSLSIYLKIPEFIPINQMQIDGSIEFENAESGDSASVTASDIFIKDIGNGKTAGWVKLTVSTSSLDEGFYNILTNDGTSYHSLQIIDSFPGINGEFKVVQITDSHVGNPASDYLKDRYQVDGTSILDVACKISDCSQLNELFNRDTSYHAAIFVASLNRINKIEKPAFVIHTGDIADVGADEQSYQVIKQALLDHLTDVPIFFTPGNHDHVGTLDNFKKYLQPEPSMVDSFRYSNYYLDYNGIRLISFDSGETLMDRQLHVCEDWAHSTQPFDIPGVQNIKRTTQFCFLEHYAANTNNIQNNYAQLYGLVDDDGLIDWIKDTYNGAHTIIFTHGPLVYNPEDGPNLILAGSSELIEWMNSESGGIPNYDNVKVEGVMSGHAHINEIYWQVKSTDVHPDTKGTTSIPYEQFDNLIVDRKGTLYFITMSLNGD